MGSLSKKDSLGTADVCQYLFELSELKIAPSGGRKIQMQILASKPNSYIALFENPGTVKCLKVCLDKKFEFLILISEFLIVYIKFKFQIEIEIFNGFL